MLHIIGFLLGGVTMIIVAIVGFVAEKRVDQQLIDSPNAGWQLTDGQGNNVDMRDTARSAISGVFTFGSIACIIFGVIMFLVALLYIWFYCVLAQCRRFLQVRCHFYILLYGF